MKYTAVALALSSGFLLFFLRDAGAQNAPVPSSNLQTFTPTADESRSALFPEGVPASVSCTGVPDTVACLLDARWGRNPEALPTVRALRRDLGIVLGVSRTFQMDGGYRGMVNFVPELPVGRYARHLTWFDGAMREIDRFARALAATPGARPVRYRWTGLTVHFARSVNTTTPNAFVTNWDVHYNVNGSVLRSPEQVVETLFHELFHSNDQLHGWWSTGALGAIHRSIASRCGTTRASTPCLAPYAPNTLRVRNGTYYAFHGGNDVREYAAELAVRYFKEHTGRWHDRPFKCGPPENARAWQAMVNEFFGGVDHSPACTR